MDIYTWHYGKILLLTIFLISGIGVILLLKSQEKEDGVLLELKNRVGGGTVTEKNGICKKGHSEFTKEFLLAELGKFLMVYDKRPDHNIDGTGIHHQFALWCTLRLLRPKYIIESGVHRGYGSWIMRQAAPKARMVMLDPRDENLKYRDSKGDTIYLVGTSGFRDFRNIDWINEYKIDPKDSLIFFDDHVNNVERTLQAYKAGFRYLIFDDNNGPLDEGVHEYYSMKVACTVFLNQTKEGSYKQHIDIGKYEIQQANRVFDEVIDIYFEFPSIWQTAKSRMNSILHVDSMEKALQLKPEWKLSRPPIEHNQQYYYICFLKLRDS